MVEPRSDSDDARDTALADAATWTGDVSLASAPDAGGGPSGAEVSREGRLARAQPWLALVAAVGLLGFAPGMLVGEHLARRRAQEATLDAVGSQRRSVDLAGTSIAGLMSRVEHACAIAGVVCGPDDPTHAEMPVATSVRVDRELLAFAAEMPDPPEGPVERAEALVALREPVQRAVVNYHVGVVSAWRALRRHALATRGREAQIEASYRDARRARDEVLSLAVVLQRSAGTRGVWSPGFHAVLVRADPRTPSGSFEITAPPDVSMPTPRTVYDGGDLARGVLIDRVAFPLVGNVGPLGVGLSALARPWAEYVSRLRDLHAAAVDLGVAQQRVLRALDPTEPSS